MLGNKYRMPPHRRLLTIIFWETPAILCKFRPSGSQIEYFAEATRNFGITGKCLGMKDGMGRRVTLIILAWPNPEAAAALP